MNVLQTKADEDIINCTFRIDLIHLQQKSLQEYVKTIVLRHYNLFHK